MKVFKFFCWSLCSLLVFLSLQIQFHSVTANIWCSPSRMHCQPISIEQTEIGNSLPCIDPVTLRLGTQHWELPTNQVIYGVHVYLCFFLFACGSRKETCTAYLTTKTLCACVDMNVCACTFCCWYFAANLFSQDTIKHSRSQYYKHSNTVSDTASVLW